MDQLKYDYIVILILIEERINVNKEINKVTINENLGEKNKKEILILLISSNQFLEKKCFLVFEYYTYSLQKNVCSKDDNIYSCVTNGYEAAVATPHMFLKFLAILI